MVVATDAGGVEAVRARLARAGAVEIDVVAPTSTRLVVLADIDPWKAGPAAAAMRSEGFMAVVRPDDGAQLVAWRRDTEPVSFGERLSVSLAFSEHPRGDLPGLVELGPGGFGSGHHPTTSMIVEWLVKRVAGGERVLDVGCGSGVLALCALRLGADRAFAVDLKPDAVHATAKNAALNGIADRCDASQLDLADVDGEFDIVAANIARAGIVALAPHLVRLTAPGGWLAVSGITPSQSVQVAQFLKPLDMVGERVVDGWSMVTFSA